MKPCASEQILLVGNPNTGKTTFFNKLTKSDEHVGNWHGVTVEEKSKVIFHDKKRIEIVDLPGIYSLHALSYEEQVAIDFIKKNRDKKIINICDINNLERNLFLTLCLIEEGCDVVLALNTTLRKPICKVNVEKLAELLKIDVVIVDAKKGIGFDKVIQKALRRSQTTQKKAEDDMFTDAEEKYEKIKEIIRQCVVRTKEVYGKNKLDKMLLNRFFAPVFFLVIMGVIFYLTFFLIGSFLSNCLSHVLDISLGRWCFDLCSSIFGKTSWVTCLVNDALIGGIGAVLSFLPQIVLLFFFLTILEESGYLSRVAFVFDDLLSKVGLSGRSIYTLLLGFGCSASAIMTARNMDDKKAKIKTVLATPFLSCSARLPIYFAVGGSFFGEKNIYVIFLLYLIGVVVAILSSLFLNKTILKSNKQSFILEFPPYRMISIKKALKVLWKNAKSFIFRIGGLLISMNVIVWILSNFSFRFSFVNNGENSMLQSIAKFIAPIFSPLGFNSWGIVVALLIGIVAKEGVVSTMILLCGSGGSILNCGAIFFSSNASVFAFLVFCLLYVPCLSTIAVMTREIGKKWTAFAIILQISVAYFVAMLFYNLFKLIEVFGTIKVVIIIFLTVILFLSILKLCTHFKKKRCNGCSSCHK